MAIFPLATALRKTVIPGYNITIFKQDLSAAFVVSLVALPLAMALSIAVGLPPQHGLYTAIVAGIITALLGGSAVQVSGPTAAFVAIVAPIVAEHGLRGIIWCQIIAGIMLMVMGMVRFGRYINYVPYPVTTGFTAGIAVVIATLALNDFLGLGIIQMQGDYLHKVGLLIHHLPAFNPHTCAVGAVTLLVIVFSGKITRLIPPMIAGIGCGTLLAFLLAHDGHAIATIGNHFTYTAADGSTHQGIPPYLPSLHLPTIASGDLFSIPSYAEFKTLLIPAMVIALLAALESLLSATVADGMTGTRHDPNAELSAIGVGNIFSGLATGIPATGAIARTAANIHSGAKTPLAAAMHGVLIMCYVLLLAPLINYIPLAALAALLLVVAYRMSHIRQFIRTIKIAPASDTLVLLTCFFLTVFIDIVAGVSVGIVLASLLFMKRIAELTQIDVGPPPEGMAQNVPLPDHVMVYRINGPLFFGSVEKAYDRYNFIHDHIRTLIIDMEHVPLIDMTGLVAMKSMLSSIAREERQIVLCGSKHITDKILQKIAGAPNAQYVHTAQTMREALRYC